MFTQDTHLEFNVPAKTAVFVDDTDYSALNLAQVQVTGTVTVTGPDGVAIVTGLTIDISASDTETTAFNLPLDTSLGILNGTYSYSYVVNFVTSGIAVDDFTATNTIDIGSVDWVDIFDVTGASDEITIIGATTPANNGTFDVVSASFVGGDTRFVVDSAAIVTEGGGVATVSFDVDYPALTDTVTYTGCDEADLTVSTPYYCNTTRYGQIIFEDTTELPTGQVLNSRLWNISYPGGLTNPVTPTDITSSAISVTVSTLATGQWTYLLTYNVTVTQADGLVYTYVISKTDNVDVSCITTICDLRCGIQTLITNYTQAVLAGSPNNAFTNAMSLVEAYWMGATNALTCGDQDKFEYYATQIQTQLNLVGVDCGCGCSDGTTTSTEGNHWIDNGSDFVSGTPPQWSIFETTGPINTTATLPPSTFGTVSIPPEYFQLLGELNILGLTQGKKFVNIEYSVRYYGVTSANTTLTVGGNTIVNAFNMTLDTKWDFKVKIGTRVSGNNTVFCIQLNANKIDSNGSTADYSVGYTEYNDLIDAVTNLAIVQTFTGADVPNIEIIDLKIYPSQQI